MNTKIWAHRGASGHAPENTLEAFAMAIAQGADGIELDVQRTADNELVVIHDETIDRVSDGHGLVRDMTLAELRKFSYHAGLDEFKGVLIPTLREVYELISPTKLTINAELKNGVILYEGMEEQVLALAEEMKMQARILYSSFQHSSMRRILQLDPTASTGLLFADGFIGVPDYAHELGVKALHPAGYLLQDPDLIEGSRKHHLLLHVWTVNEKDDLRKVFQAGVDAVITNYPDRARAVLEEI